MTLNEAIALTNIVLACSLIALGVLFLWQAHTRRSLFKWPLSALVVLGIVPLLTGLLFFQSSIFRIWAFPYPFDVNDPGTLALRVFTTVVVIYKVIRVYRGKLLTVHDGKRIIHEGGAT